MLIDMTRFKRELHAQLTDEFQHANHLPTSDDRGSLSRKEWNKAGLDEKYGATAFNKLDTNDNNRVSYKEFMELYNRAVEKQSVLR